MSVKSEYNIGTQSIILDALRLLNINNVDAEKAVKIYNKYLNVKYVGKRSRRLLAYTALYILLRLEHVPITINRFARVLNVSVKSLSSCYRSMIRELGLLLPSIDIERYVDYILGSLNADTLYDLRYDALYMAKCLKDDNAINSKNPAGVAAAIVCLAISKRDPVNAGRYIREVALLAGVSIVTLKKRIKELNTILS
jgi:transcription initiation factor TFIIIB Brf1 subunit/transcription initiation factor TFIIB